MVGQKLYDFETCKQELKNIGLTADNLFTTGEQNKVATSAMEEERKKFADFIDNLTSSDLNSVEPLPHRRRLTKEESKQVRQSLLKHWNFEGNYWEPLEELSPKPTIFLMKDNITDSDHEQIVGEIKKYTNVKLNVVRRINCTFEKPCTNDTLHYQTYKI